MVVATQKHCMNPVNLGLQRDFKLQNHAPRVTITSGDGMSKSWNASLPLLRRSLGRHMIIAVSFSLATLFVFITISKRPPVRCIIEREAWPNSKEHSNCTRLLVRTTPQTVRLILTPYINFSHFFFIFWLRDRRKRSCLSRYGESFATRISCGVPVCSWFLPHISFNEYLIVRRDWKIGSAPYHQLYQKLSRKFY